MPSTSYTRPPGFYDRPPAESLEASEVTATLQQVMNRFGYQPIETPLLEYADLFLTKSGDDAMNRLFTFEMYGRLLCLRSEFTPSAARLYIERYQHEPKPIRWQLTGPVFRYESPQRSHSRQFTMVGAELIGDAGTGGDAETIGMAAAGLFGVGLREWTLVIGHVGLIGALLDQFQLERRTRRYLLGQIENLRRRGRAYVEAQIERLYAGLPADLENIEALSEDGMRRTLQMLLASADLGTTGAGRGSEDIARRLLNKQRRANQRDVVGRALDFLERLITLEGSPAHVLPQLEKMLPSDEAIQSQMRGFRAAIGLLGMYGVGSERVKIHLGLARGLNYYTGIVFEAHAPGEDSASQLCGGGRYDDYLRVIGAAQDTPAVGLAFGLERILSERKRLGLSSPSAGVAVLVVPIEDDDDPEAARVAMLLRESLNTELHMPPARSLSKALTTAGRRGVPFVILVGAAERVAGQVTLRDMRTGQQQMLSPMDARQAIREGMGQS